MSESSKSVLKNVFNSPAADEKKKKVESTITGPKNSFKGFSKMLRKTFLPKSLEKHADIENRQSSENSDIISYKVESEEASSPTDSIYSHDPNAQGRQSTIDQLSKSDENHLSRLNSAELTQKKAKNKKKNPRYKILGLFKRKTFKSSDVTKEDESDFDDTRSVKSDSEIYNQLKTGKQITDEGKVISPYDSGKIKLKRTSTDTLIQDPTSQNIVKLKRSKSLSSSFGKLVRRLSGSEREMNSDFKVESIESYSRFSEKLEDLREEKSIDCMSIKSDEVLINFLGRIDSKIFVAINPSSEPELNNEYKIMDDPDMPKTTIFNNRIENSPPFHERLTTNHEQLSPHPPIANSNNVYQGDDNYKNDEPLTNNSELLLSLPENFSQNMKKKNNNQYRDNVQHIEIINESEKQTMLPSEKILSNCILIHYDSNGPLEFQGQIITDSKGVFFHHSSFSSIGDKLVSGSILGKKLNFHIPYECIIAVSPLKNYGGIQIVTTKQPIFFHHLTNHVHFVEVITSLWMKHDIRRLQTSNKNIIPKYLGHATSDIYSNLDFLVTYQSETVSHQSGCRCSRHYGVSIVDRYIEMFPAVAVASIIGIGPKSFFNNLGNGAKIVTDGEIDFLQGIPPLLRVGVNIPEKETGTILRLEVTIKERVFTPDRCIVDAVVLASLNDVIGVIPREWNCAISIRWCIFTQPQRDESILKDISPCEESNPLLELNCKLKKSFSEPRKYLCRVISTIAPLPLCGTKSIFVNANDLKGPDAKLYSIVKEAVISSSPPELKKNTEKHTEPVARQDLFQALFSYLIELLQWNIIPKLQSFEKPGRWSWIFSLIIITMFAVYNLYTNSKAKFEQTLPYEYLKSSIAIDLLADEVHTADFADIKGHIKFMIGPRPL